MKLFLLEHFNRDCYAESNLGDDLQTVAAGRLLPRVDGYLDRESLNAATETGIVVLNGFFMNTRNWPPAPSLTPVFFGFHITPSAESWICSPGGIAYLKEHAPIGCRDLGTVALLERYGVEAYYSKCLSLTLERRQEPPRAGKIYMVGINSVERSIIPKPIRKQAIEVDQNVVRLPGLPPAIKFDLVRHLLDVYKNTASLVITSKIHCAMPCIAMGIPVVFLWNRAMRDEYRVKIVDDLIGINYVPGTRLDRKMLNRFRSNRIDWEPDPIDMEEEKRQIIQRFQEALDAARLRHLAKHPAN